MSSIVIVPLTQAASFVAGCFALHRVQRHAAGVTPYLVLAAAFLVSLVLAALTLQLTAIGDAGWVSVAEADLVGLAILPAALP